MNKFKCFVAILLALGGSAVFTTLVHADGVAIVAADPAAPAVDASLLVSTGKSLFEAVKMSNWTMVFALGLLLLTYLLRMFLIPKLNMHPTKWLPLLVTMLGVAGAFATNMAAGQSWLSALLAGVTVGTSASGLWNLVGGALPAPPAPKA